MLGRAAAPVHAAILNWNNAAGGSAATAANWSPVQVPTASDDLTFNLAATYPVTFSSSVSGSRTHTYRRGTVTLTMTSPHTTSNGVAIADLAGDVSTVVLTTGVWSSGPAGFVNIGDASGTTGVFEVNDDDAEFVVTGTSDLFVGNNGTGTLNITGGGTVTVADTLHVGQGSAGNGSLTVSGFVTQAPFPISSLEVSGAGESRWGNGGDATVNVSNGALAHFAGDLVLGNLSTSISNVTVQGPGIVFGATLDVDGDLLVGRNTSAGTAAGSATLNVNSQGRVIVGGTLFVAGDPDGGSGTVTMESGSLIEAVNVSLGAPGVLNHNGGTLRINGGTFGGHADPLTVTGTGNPTLHLSNDVTKTLTAAGFVGLIVGSDVGAGTFSGNLLIDGGSELILSGTGKDIHIGEHAGTTGTITVDGAGSRLVANQPGDDLLVGFNGAGTLNINNGAQVLARNVLVPAINTADGMIELNGNNSTLTTVNLTVGHSSGSGTGAVVDEFATTINATDPGTSVVIRNTGLLAITGQLNATGTVLVAGGDLQVHRSLSAGVLVDVDTGGALLAGAGPTPAVVDAPVRIRQGGLLGVNANDLTVGDPTDTNGFEAQDGSHIAVGNRRLTLLDADRAITHVTTINGGEIIAPNGMEIVTQNVVGTLDGTGSITTSELFMFSGGSVITATGVDGITINGKFRSFSGLIDGTKYTFNNNPAISDSGWIGAGTIAAKVVFNAGTTITSLANMTMGDGSASGVTFNAGSVMHMRTRNVTLLDSNGLGLPSLTTMNGGNLISPNGLVVNSGRVLRGRGDIDVINSALSILGTIDPSADEDLDDAYFGLGALDIAGAFSMDTGAHYFCEIGGFDNEFRQLVDFIDVSGAATLNGTLHLSIINGYVPQLGDVFNIMRFASRTGTFAFVEAPCLRPLGLKLDVIYNATNVQVVVVADSSVGDMNCDCSVNFFDIDPFLLALFDPAGYEAAFPNCDINNADIDGSNSIDFFDIDPFLILLFS